MKSVGGRRRLEIFILLLVLSELLLLAVACSLGVPRIGIFIETVASSWCCSFSILSTFFNVSISAFVDMKVSAEFPLLRFTLNAMRWLKTTLTD